MKKILFASSNRGKLSEIKALLPEGFELLSPSDIGFDGEIEENGYTFEENAEIKAKVLFEHSGIPSFADDSGLEVEALKGAPGVRSARYGGENSNSRTNNVLLLKNMEGKKNRKARFVCVICLISSAGKILLFEGSVSGIIANEERGDKGFGYDPVFIPEGYDQTFAELGSEIKNKMSHRTEAFNKMLPFLEFL